MGIPKEIEIEGENENKIKVKKKYYYWSEYETYSEAISYAKKIKEERKKQGMKVKYFILESQEGWFLPIPKYVLYLNKNLRII